ncbi:restriction endonuclease subunit S [Porphyromonadaceae bacterium OttesenSCG-928-L07]|nr:restriction endonuclease subunit S [Porphyromonadaceae bacterium OttesenSCG-928-L07]
MRFPGFEGEWEEKKLGEIADKVNSGKTPLGGEAIYTKEGVLFIRSQNVNNDKLELENSVFIPEVVNRQMENSIVHPNDILLNITGASLGRSCVVPDTFKCGNVNQHVCIIRLKKQYNPRFVQPLLSSSKGQTIFTNLQTGSGREGLTFESIKSIKISIPFHDEQQKIASFLSLIDDRITTQNKIIKKYESLIKGLSNNLFSSEQGEYPKLRFPKYWGMWSKVKIGDILTIGSGRDYKHLHKGNIPVYGTGGYMTSVNNFLYDGESVCIGRKGTINKPFFLKGKFWTVDTLFYTHSFKNILPAFGYFIFNRINWLKYNEASGIPSLSKTTIESIPVLIPLMEEQSQIVNTLLSINNKIEFEREILALCEKQKKYLLQQMFI